MLVVDDDFAGTGNHHQLALAVGHVAHRGVETDRTVGLGFHAGGHRGTRRRTTDVEGAHGQLRARFTDRLRGNHADRFTDVDQAAATQIAAVALGADAEAGFAGQCGAHLDFVHAGGFELVEHVFVEHGACSAITARVSGCITSSAATCGPGYGRAATRSLHHLRRWRA
jgi:hypothetical protein